MIRNLRHLGAFAALNATVEAKLHAGGFTAKKTGYRHSGLNAREPTREARKTFETGG